MRPRVLALISSNSWSQIAQPNSGRMSRSPLAVDSTMAMERSMSSGPPTSAIEPVWSIRIGNEMPRPMNVAASLLVSPAISFARSIDLHHRALDDGDARRLQVGERALGLERAGGL